MSDVALHVRQNRRSHHLATSDAGDGSADDLGHISWQVFLPSALHAGEAFLIAEGRRFPVVLTR